MIAGLAKFGLQFGFPTINKYVVDYVHHRQGRDRRPGAAGAEVVLSRGERLEWLAYLALIGTGLLLAYLVATFFRDYLTGQLGFRVIRDLRQDLFGHLHRLSLHFYSKERTGSIVSRVISDISQASNLVNGGVVAVAMDAFAMIFGAIILFYMSPTLAVVALLVLPLNAVAMNYMRPHVKQAGTLVQRSIGRISGNVQEQLAGIASCSPARARAARASDFGRTRRSITTAWSTRSGSARSSRRSARG